MREEGESEVWCVIVVLRAETRYLRDGTARADLHMPYARCIWARVCSFDGRPSLTSDGSLFAQGWTCALHSG